MRTTVHLIPTDEAGWWLPIFEPGIERWSRRRLEQLGVPDQVAHTLAAAALGIGALWLVRQARQGQPRLALGACLLLLTTPWLLPWYATWPVVLAAVEEDAVAQVLALGLAVYLLPDRVPF